MTHHSAGRGKVVVFEGGEGSGKTTQLRRLASSLEARGIRHVSLQEPGGTPLGAEVRRVLLDRASDVVPRAEALLFMASRAQLVDREIRPAVERGDVVLLDRFSLSTYAYQMAGHGLRDAEVRSANSFATAGLVPDLTILLIFPPREGLVRAATRAASHDRIEAFGEDFHARVAAAFATFADAAWQAAHPECGPIIAVSGEGTADDVSERVHAVVAGRWPDFFELSLA